MHKEKTKYWITLILSTSLEKWEGIYVPNGKISALEAAIRHVDIAAEVLDLEPGICKILRKPSKSVIVAVPARRDGGEINVFLFAVNPFV